MVRKELTILNRLGLHARAAAKFVTLASRFQSDIHLLRGQQQASGKSIMGVMMLAAAQGSRVEIRASGVDEIEALCQLEALIEQRFGEKE